MKNLLWFLVLCALTAFGAGKDIYGNNITNSTLIGNVDGELTTVGDINALKVETDPTVPSWAKTPEKPVYNAGEVGARPNNWMPSAADVGALPNNQDALVGNPNFSNAVISASGISAEANARAAGDAALDAKIATKQTNLVSGVNIKTINGDSILGSGNIVVQGGASLDVTQIVHGHGNEVGSNDPVIAIGISNKVDSADAAALGFYASASGTHAMAVGPYAVANGPYTVALGGADAVGEGAIGIGCATLASNDCATAVGYNSKALGAASSAVGFMCAASNDYDVAMGVQATAFGGQSTAFGAAATAGGYDSFAAGFMARAFLDYATCIGWGSLARGYSACVVGNSSFATNWSAAVGRSNDAKGPSSVAIGYGCEADETASSGVAIGNNIEISGIQSMAMGWGVRKAQRWGWDLTGASCYSRNGLAVGGHISTNAPYSVTIGQYAFAEHPHSVVISAQTNWTTTSTLSKSKGAGTINFAVESSDPEKIYIGEKNLLQIINESSGGGMWDEELHIWWTPKMTNGKLVYMATTNVNIQAGN